MGNKFDISMAPCVILGEKIYRNTEHDKPVYGRALKRWWVARDGRIFITVTERKRMLRLFSVTVKVPKAEVVRDQSW